MLFGAGAYLLYVLALGPLCALDGRGYLGFVPEPIGTVIMAPARPVVIIPGVRYLFLEYLDFWYHDPSDPYSRSAWQQGGEPDAAGKNLRSVPQLTPML